MNEQGQAQPGWYQDPSGPQGQKRWWDGTRWTEHTQPAPGGAPAFTAPAAAPSSGGSNALKIILIVLGVLALLTIGGCVACAALVGETANEVEQGINRELERQQNKNAITKREFDSVELGTRRSAVERRFGRPEDRQEFENRIPGGEPVGSSCIYYNRAGGEFGDVFQLCFSDGRLDSKNAY